jgi:hypothetical protein
MLYTGHGRAVLLGNLLLPKRFQILFVAHQAVDSEALT